MNKLFDGNHPFVRRCTAALTHPVTIGALGLLLLNDLLFKSLWSNLWTTGKLSDLTWVVFASPLLAFFLSPFARRGRLAERIVFVIAYVGLPVLYAAFNTFPVVHDAILWALSFAGGTGPGAPLDPTDSLVIPFGLAIAIWVWRREPPVSNSLRMRFGLLTAGVAALASVASTPIEPIAGVTAVEVESDGTIVSVWDESAVQSVVTPSGTYTIEGPYIMRTHNGERTVAYSTAYLQEDENIAVQKGATRKFGLREITTEPYSIIYDENSGNVIAAMGLQGAVVGTPNGQWTRVAVGEYVPTDFSFVAKLSLFRDWQFWLPALAVAFSFTVIAMVLAESSSYDKRQLLLVISLLAISASFVGIFFYDIGGAFDDSGVLTYYSPSFLLMTSLSIFGSAIGLILAFAVIAVSYWNAKRMQSADTSSKSTTFILKEFNKGLYPAIATSLLGMILLVFLAFLLWIQTGALDAKIIALILVALATFCLQRYLKSKRLEIRRTT